MSSKPLSFQAGHPLLNPNDQISLQTFFDGSLVIHLSFGFWILNFRRGQARPNPEVALGQHREVGGQGKA